MTAHFVSAAVDRETGYRGNHPLAIPRIGPVEAMVAALCPATGTRAAGEV